MNKLLFQPEKEDFNIIVGNNHKNRKLGSFNQINWKPQQLEIFKELKKIHQDIWIQIYDVYIDSDNNVYMIGFRITPELSFHHEYPVIIFNKKGNMVADLNQELESYKEKNKECYEIVIKFYKVLISLQSKQKIN